MMDEKQKPVMYIVKATIPSAQEEQFNQWYNDVHCPQLMEFPGVLSAKRYKSLMGESHWQYLAVYEFQDEPTWIQFMESDHLKMLKADYDLQFGAVSERGRFAYQQVWP